MNLKLIALIMFICMYAVMIIKPKYRVHAAAVTAVLFIATGILPFAAIPAAINWNVLMMLLGTMIIVDYFIASKMPNLIAEFLLDHSKNVMWVTIYMSLFAGLVSAFIDNIPFAATMVPVISSLAATSGVHLDTLAWALSMGTDIGGSATPIGASANVVGMSVAAKSGHPVTWGEYCKHAVPATLIVLVISTLVIFARYL